MSTATQAETMGQNTVDTTAHAQHPASMAHTTLCLQQNIVFTKTHPLFQTHFLGHPCVPGSLAIKACLDILAQYGYSVVQIRRFRFLRFMPPGQYRLELSLTTNKARCAIWQETTLMLQGSLEIMRRTS